MKSNNYKTNYNSTTNSKYVDTKTGTHETLIAFQAFSIAFDSRDFRYGNHKIVVNKEYYKLISDKPLNRQQIDESVRAYKDYYVTPFHVKAKRGSSNIEILIDNNVPGIISDSRLTWTDQESVKIINSFLDIGSIRLGTNRNTWEILYYAYQHNISPLPCVSGGNLMERATIVLNDKSIVTVVKEKGNSDITPLERYSYEVDDFIYTILLTALCQSDAYRSIQALYININAIMMMLISDEETRHIYTEQIISLCDIIMEGLDYEITVR